MRWSPEADRAIQASHTENKICVDRIGSDKDPDYLPVNIVDITVNGKRFRLSVNNQRLEVTSPEGDPISVHPCVSNTVAITSESR